VPGSKAAGIAMAFKLIDAAQARWRAVNAPHLVALVRAGARFECGKLVERDPYSRPPKPPTSSVAHRLESIRQQRRVTIFIHKS
jgi:putative transposase